MSDPIKRRIHPLVATAAVAVTLVCLVGVAAITGLIPTSNSSAPPVAAMSAPAPGVDNQPSMNNSNIAPTPALAANQNNNPAPSSQSNYVAEQRHAPPPSQRYANEQQSPPPAPVCYSCGRVESIQAIQQAAKPSGLGIAAGAILGGVLGHQVGHGNGNTLATVAGAVGGGFAGNEVESRTRTTTSYRVEVRMENGKLRSFPQSAQEWRVGDPVRVVDGHLEGRG
ncbi:glycine zipper 2TM domain-containing protein [Glaciimonas sp. CA11.2]|uniref:glycine zipper 2TM domain-containing protein n=1 Tax=unclassified Glaciimonas TaxID=2644401 RepID=UPI002AB51CA3|nr:MULTISPECIES: glycine zipper 2TM domain-containing protein [unclassified Glaciimonas]MDY7549078.1 glycine zipper 2TM domain-containing protein [Glaciimonas sp. CA11.2]MEB0013129.1 glycine zipper 2TM domain-containing protein [Glaciimonas sp. Cout2]MEB0081988.1 glycine zipper 2TM domain-containing protein [Glaciimonas sp. Gout2]MEB0164360.1 glycine zipper 2TM domain-containing protein [Glaciimonas sp. CA11.2]